jgi:hypothetical protein
MNGIPKWISLIAVAAYAAFAFPSLAAKKPPPPQAQDKSYSIEFLLPSMAMGPNGLQQNPLYDQGAVTGDEVIRPPVTIVVYVKNESPPSTAASNASSLSFDLAPSLVLVAQPTCPRGQCSATGSTVSVTNISPPIQAKEIFPITLQVNTCVVVNEAFITHVAVSTGSQITNGQPFAPYNFDANFQYSTTLSTRGGTAYPIDFTTTDTPVVTGISCGKIACEQSFTIGNLDPSNLDYRTVTGWRGLNTDGTCSTSHLGYFLTNKLGVSLDPNFPATQRSLHFVWPADTSPPVFAYKLTRDTDDTGTDWFLGWAPKDSVPPVLLDADNLHCNTFFPPEHEPTAAELPLPTVYGVLNQAGKMKTKQLKVDTGGNPPPPITGDGLPIMVETERMLVTSIDSSGWSVTRTNPMFHNSGKFVVSTPMPLLDTSLSWPSPYVAGTAAKMCLVWTNATGTAAWAMDGSDGWVRGF